VPGSTSRRALAAAVSIFILASSACQRREGANTASGAPDTAGGMTTGTADTGQARPAESGNLSDANIVALLDEANMADSASGAYAVTKATNPEVKAFARLMMGEHHALRAQGQKLAKQLNVTPEPPANDPLKPAAQSEMTALKAAAKGAAFDRTYIEQEVGIHKAVLDLAEKAHDAAQNEQLKQLIEQAKPVIEKHLKRAEELQKKLGTPSA
jgi:putative membrane protein